MRRLGCHENISMHQFKTKFGKDLALTVTNSTTQMIEFLTAESHPDMPVYLALRASCAIPGAFLPVYWKGNLYVDGGCAANYPVWAFDGDTNTPRVLNKYAEMNMKTIGVNLQLPSLNFDHASRKKSLTVRVRGRSSSLVRRHRISRVAFPRMVEFGGLLHVHDSERDVLSAVQEDAEDNQESSPTPERVIQMANYPRLFDVFGFMGFGKLFLNTAEFIWKSQNRPQDSVRTIAINRCSAVGTLEFSISRDQDRLIQVAKDATKSTMDFLRGLTS